MLTVDHQMLVEDAMTNIAFRHGDTVLQCKCGARYYPQSLITLCEHNDGKCITCGDVRYHVVKIGDSTCGKS